MKNATDTEFVLQADTAIQRIIRDYQPDIVRPMSVPQLKVKTIEKTVRVDVTEIQALHLGSVMERSPTAAIIQ